MNNTDNLNNSLFTGKAVVFDQMSFWLVIGVIAIFFAGTVFGRLTDWNNNASTTNDSSQSIAHHHSVYGRFGELRWLH